MATTLNDQTHDLLARFLPPNTDARVISNYLGLLAESELRLRQEVNELRSKIKPLPQVEAPETTRPAHKKDEEQQPVSRKPSVKIIDQKKLAQQITAIRKPSNSVAEVNYKIGLRHLEAGDKEDISQAIDCFLTADAYGHAKASVALAELFYYGKHVSKDLEKSLLYYQNAAATGHAHALYSVAYMTYYGEGDTMDKDEAVNLLRMAASKGSTDAKEMLDWLRC